MGVVEEVFRQECSM